MSAAVKRTALLLTLATLAWFGYWYTSLSDDVARVRMSLHYHGEQFKSTNRYVTFKADGVGRSGFPFTSQVRIKRPTLSMVWGKETFAISLPELVLENVDARQARYRVALPQTFDALYAIDGAAPEHYEITLNTVPKLLVRAQGNSTRCPDLPGMTHCQVPAADTPFLSFAASLPALLQLNVALNGASKSIEFRNTAIAVPVFYDVPNDASSALMLFVGMLREAMVYQK